MSHPTIQRIADRIDKLSYDPVWMTWAEFDEIRQHWQLAGDPWESTFAGRCVLIVDRFHQHPETNS
jgi:hypothetical protein